MKWTQVCLIYVHLRNFNKHFLYVYSESRCSILGWQYVWEVQMKVYYLTGDSDVTIGLPLIYDIHHLLRTRHKAFGAALNTQHTHVYIHLVMYMRSPQNMSDWSPSHTGHGSCPRAQTGWSLWLKTQKRELKTEDWTTNTSHMHKLCFHKPSKRSRIFSM